jgi:hypothetical protein
MDNSMQGQSRRQVLKAAGTALLTVFLASQSAECEPDRAGAGERPVPGDRRFRSDVVEQYLADLRARIPDPELANWDGGRPLLSRISTFSRNSCVHYVERNLCKNTRQVIPARFPISLATRRRWRSDFPSARQVS